MRALFTLVFFSLLSVVLWGQPINRMAHPAFSFHQKHMNPGAGNFKNSFSDGLPLHTISSATNPQNADARSILVDKQRLDSIIDKSNYGSLELVNDYKDVFVYNVKGDLTLYTELLWNKTGNKWENRSKEEYTYNTADKMSSYISYDWDPAGTKWDTYEKALYEYDTDGKPITETVMEWNQVSMKWQNSNKSVSTYDGNGWLIEKVLYMWDESSGQWLNMLKYVYTNNSAGGNALVITKIYDETTVQWMDFSKEENTYDVSGNLILYISSSWDAVQSKWINDFKYEYTYNVNHAMTSYIGSAWNTLSQAWTGEFKEEYLYDTFGNRTENKQYEWDAGMLVWVLSSKTTQSFTNSFGFDDLVLPWFYIGDASEMFVHRLDDFSYYSYNGAGWDLNETMKLYYSSINTTDIKDQKSAKLLVYPNPTSDFVEVEGMAGGGPSQIELFDNLGQLVKQQTFALHQKVDLHHFPAGLYYYRVKDGTGVMQSGKIMIK